jgi:hypothetical protein
MDKRQSRALTALYAADVFLEAHASRLPKTTVSGAREQFARTLAELICHVQMQEASPLMAQGLTRANEVKRAALLRDHMAPIARVAKLEASSIPALALLKMPRGEPGFQKLLAHATGMAVAAAEYRDVFIGAGCKSTFVEDLQAAISDMVETLTNRTQRRGDRSAATKGVDVALKRCRRTLAVLDAFVRSEAHEDLELIAAWCSVKRVRRAPVRHKAPSDDLAAAGERDVKILTPIREAQRLLPATVPDLCLVAPTQPEIGGGFHPSI